MHHFTINGVARDFPLPIAESFDHLLEYIRGQFVNDGAWISSIRINGAEMTEADEAAFAARPLAEIGDVEVFTAHPRELAEDTLQTLLVFTQHLEAFSYQAADAISSGGGRNEFMKLIDGIETFTESLLTAKQILRIATLEAMDVLEADLASVLKALTDYYQRDDRSYVCDLLRHHLPANIREWRERGIPAIIHSRDS